MLVSRPMLPPGRRTFLAQLAAGVGGAWVTLSQADLLAIHQHARQAAATHPARFVVLTPDQAADVAAMAAAIIPTDTTPGATEAHVVYFIDRMLETSGKDDERPVYMAGLPMLQAKTIELVPQATTFSALGEADRRRVLTAIEASPFFQLVRAHTIAGFLSDPKYGGNANEIGWKHIGFTPAFAYQPPFGDYDRDAAVDSPGGGR